MTEIHYYPNGQLLNSIHCHEQWSSGRFSLFNYFKTSRILRRYAPAAAARISPLVAQKRCTSPFIYPISLVILLHLALRQTPSWIFLKQTLPPNYFIWKKWPSNFLRPPDPPCFNCPPSFPPNPEIPSLRRQPLLPSFLPPSPPLSSDTSPTHCYKLLIQYDAFILHRKCATGSFLYRVQTYSKRLV